MVPDEIVLRKKRKKYNKNRHKTYCNNILILLVQKQKNNLEEYEDFEFFKRSFFNYSEVF